MSYKSQLTPDSPLPISLTAILIVPLLLYLLYLRFSTRWLQRQQKRNQHTQMQKLRAQFENETSNLQLQIQQQREQYEHEAVNLQLQIQQLNEHISRLRTEQILREKQTLQLRNRLEQREKLLDRFTAEILPAALNIPELSTAARNLQQACRTAELSARFDNKLLQRLPPSFERAITQMHPKLSEEDIRLAGYLFLDLPNKEIAQLRNISAAGVSKSRNRLRKKLGLKPEQDLTAFMRSLTDSYPDQIPDQLAEKILPNEFPDHQRPAELTKNPFQRLVQLPPTQEHKSAA